MSKTPILLILCLLLHTLCYGDEQHLRYEGLAATVQINGMEHGIPVVHLHHNKVGPPPNASLTIPSLSDRVPVASFQHLRCTATYSGWRVVAPLIDTTHFIQGTTVQPLGSVAWQKTALLSVWPWRSRDGKLEIADTVIVSVYYDPASDLASPVVVQDRSWYDPAQPYVRIQTSTAGIGAISMAEVMNIEPRFNSAVAGQLVLYWKGTEQALSVIGKNAESVLAPTDTVLFMSRFAQGDTSYLSTEDSTAVMFLSLKNEGDRQRLKLVDGVASETSLSQVTITERLELDTGYYHLGSATEDDYSAFVTGQAFLEGFYWANLNTNAYGRASCNVELTPAPDGMVTLKTLYAIGTDVEKFNPDSRIDVSMNGSIPTSKVTDGFARYSIETKANGRHCPSGLQTLKWYATGIDSLRPYKEYFSQVLIDAVEIQADVLPVLQSGRIRAQIPERTVATNISWYNAAETGWWLDTANHMLGTLTASRPGSVVKGGLSPIECDWPTIPDIPSSWRVCASFNDTLLVADSVTDIVLFTWSPLSAPTRRILQSESELTALLTQLTPSTQIVLSAIGRIPSAPLKNALQQNGLPIPSAGNWLIAGIIGVGGELQESSSRTALGSTYLVDRNIGTGTIADSHVPAGPATTLYVSTTQALEWARVMPAHLNNLTSDVRQADMIIVTHSTHAQQAERMAAHRRSHNSLSVKVIDVDAILDEFGYGMHKPEAIQAYLSWHYANARTPRLSSVLLFGNASWDIRLAVKRGNVNAERPDQVPTFGRPSSDYYYGTLDDRGDLALPEALVGRLPALTADEGRIMVDKIIYNDTVQFQPWMRTWFFVGGGSGEEGLCSIFQDMLTDPFGTGVTFTTPPLCIDTTTLCKSTAPSNAGFYLRKRLDAGTQWMNYVGHGATNIFDINGWEPNELNNEGKFGILATYACQTGSYSNPSVPCKNAQYLTADNKGMVAALGSTGWQHIWAVSLLHQRIHEAQRAGLRSVGEILNSARVPLYNPSQQATVNTVLQYTLLGDPNSRLFIDTVPRLRITTSDIQVVPQSTNQQLTDRDSIARVTVRVTNMGTGTLVPLTVHLRHTYDNVSETYESVLNDGICSNATAVFSIPILNKPGEHRVSIIVDPQLVIDPDTTNHKTSAIFTVLPQSLLAIEPVPFEQLPTNVVHVRMLDPLGSQNPGTVRMAIARSQNLSDTNLLAVSTTESIVRDGSIIDWETTLAGIAAPTRVYIAGWTITGNDTSAIAWIPIEVNSPEPSRARCMPTDLLSAGNNMVYSKDRDGWVLNTVTLPILLRSMGVKSNDANSNPPLVMSIGSMTYVRNEFYRGINLIVLNAFDTIPKAIRRYDTWKDPEPPGLDNFGSTKELIKFLQDSVDHGQTVLFAACDEAFSGFLQDTTMEAFRSLLKSYGSNFADSLGPNSSWAMVGHPNATPGSAIEAWKGAPDSLAIVSDALSFYQRDGTVYSPLIGPGIRWDSIEVTYDTLASKALLFAEGLDGILVPLGTLDSGVTKLDAVLVGKSAKRLQITWSQVYSPEGTSVVRGARFYYQPANELHLEPDALTVTPLELQRGDTAVSTVLLRNADRRFASETATATVRAGQGNNIIDSTFAVQSLPPDGVSHITFQFASDILPSQAPVTVTVDPQVSLTEFYRYNNSCTKVLSVREDSVGPVILASANGRVLKDGDYVPERPMFTISVHDNSKLKIVDESRIMAFVNGIRIRKEAVSSYTFMPTDSCQEQYDDSTLRAVMKFEFPMDQGQNNILVRAQDATGNPSELELSVFLATSNNVSSVAVYPNPTFNISTFKINVQSPAVLTPVTIHIADLQGRLVKTITTELPVGPGDVVWDGMDTNGNSVAPGVYVWDVELPNSSTNWQIKMAGTLQRLH